MHEAAELRIRASKTQVCDTRKMGVMKTRNRDRPSLPGHLIFPTPFRVKIAACNEGRRPWIRRHQCHLSSAMPAQGAMAPTCLSWHKKWR